MLLRAGGAAGEVRAHAGHGRLGVGAIELELDVPVELLEALVAVDGTAGRAEQPREQVVPVVSLSPTLARSVRRASWSVL